MRRSLAAVAAMSVAVTAGTLGGWAVAQDRIAPGVRAAGLDVGGRTGDDARSVLSGAAARFARAPVLVIDGDTVWPTTNDEIGIALDTERAATVALAVGRSGSMSDRIGAVRAGMDGAIDIGWPRRATNSRLDAFVERVARDAERAPADGDVVVDAAGVRVTPALVGLRVDRALLRADILASHDEVAVVALAVEPLVPSIDEDLVERVGAQATAAYAPMRVTAGSESVTVDASVIGAALRVARGEQGMRLDVDRTAVDALIGDLAASLEGGVREAILVPGDQHLVVMPSRDGVIVDRAAAAGALSAAILAGVHTVALPAEVTSPAFTTADATRISTATELAGSFTTSFPVNEARRINISRAAATFDGMVIGPGETFSFWDRIGEVSTRTGYAYAGAIIGGVSSTAIGGGLCQVSTTLFNAVAAAGYAIDERHPHAYYIERYPMGLDAAVFAPDTDLVWTNDTAVPAIIRAAATETSVSFWIYSAPTGRVSTFSEPQEWNFRWPAPGQAADPAHAPGYVVLGRDVLVTRTVIEAGGDVVHRDDFYSHYAPVWGGPAR